MPTKTASSGRGWPRPAHCPAHRRALQGPFLEFAAGRLASDGRMSTWGAGFVRIARGDTCHRAHRSSGSRQDNAAQPSLAQSRYANRCSGQRLRGTQRRCRSGGRPDRRAGVNRRGMHLLPARRRWARRRAEEARRPGATPGRNHCRGQWTGRPGGDRADHRLQSEWLGCGPAGLSMWSTLRITSTPSTAPNCLPRGTARRR